MANYVLVGADPAKCQNQHPGGVLTLSGGLIDYAAKQNHRIEVINTARSGFTAEPMVNRAMSGLGRIVTLIELLSRSRYDGVIIFAGAGFSFYERVLMSAVCRLWRTKDLFVVVDGWFLGLESQSKMKRTLMRLLMNIPYRFAASGERWVEFFKRFGVKSEKIVKIHYWLPVSFTPAVTPKKREAGKPAHFLFLGWMIYEKGVGEILNAIEALRPEHEFRFTLIGGGTLLDQTRQHIDANGWSKQVNAPGWVSSAELHRYMQEADIFVLPSYAEGFPMSLIEALSMGMPAIVSDVGGVSDSVRDGVNGFLIPPQAVDPLIQAMRRYLIDPSIIATHSAISLSMSKQNHDAPENCRRCFDALS